MARSSDVIRLLNCDGSINRVSIGPMEARDFITSDRVSVHRRRNLTILRLKPLPNVSESDPSFCMPTLADMCMYAESRNVPPEVTFKIEACAPAFMVRLMDRAAFAAAASA